MTGQKAPSASTESFEIVEKMNSKYYLDQVEGRFTYIPNDDWFDRKEENKNVMN